MLFLLLFVSMDARTTTADGWDQWQIYSAHLLCISYSYDLHFDCQFGHIFILFMPFNISRTHAANSHFSPFGVFLCFFLLRSITFWNGILIYDLAHACTHLHTETHTVSLKCHFTERTSHFHHVPKSIFI